LNSELTKIESNIDVLRLSVGTPEVVELNRNIETLKKGIDIAYDLWIYEM